MHQSKKIQKNLLATCDFFVGYKSTEGRYPFSGAEVGPKGWAVRPLKRYVSWVQNVVRQFGPYPSQAKEV
ncbi:Putative hydrolase [Heliorestis convoluta]|uniref:Hydrolase n=1 Tax=Heliorestis convoluta TaxID=356322 RepID=A0A5Q2MYI7_9FIRM|nr:Putative hydrolase [Heliorestis convoluta]